MVRGPNVRLRITNLSATAPRDTLDTHLSHADHSLMRTCALTIPVVSVLTVHQDMTVKATNAQYAPVLVVTLATPSSPVREESANDTASAVITWLAMLTPARIHVTLTWALCVVKVPNVTSRIINLSVLAHLVMMVTHCSHVVQDAASSLTDHHQS